jgi:uncharacterized protein YndB with AHSA1/START domain
MTKGTTQVVAEPGVPQIIITREFAAPRELLFRAYTEPDLLVQWLGPRQMTMTIDHFEVRHGGTWRYVHRDTNGTEFGFRGVFHGTPSPDGIVQTFEFEGAPGHVSLETVTFEALDGQRTRVSMNSIYQSVAARDAMIQSGMEHGVSEGFDRLETLLAQLGGQE